MWKNGAVENHHLGGRQARAGRALDGLTPQRRDGDQHSRVGVGELTGDVPGGVQRVEGGRGGAGPKDPVKRDCECRAVGRQQPDDVAGADSALRQRSGERIDADHQLAVGDRGSGFRVDECHPVGVAVGQVAEQVVVDAGVRDRHVGEGACEGHGGVLSAWSSRRINRFGATRRKEASSSSATSPQSTSAAVRSSPSQPADPR